MPRPRPPHLHPQRGRLGQTIWYVRVGHGPRTRMRAPYGSPEFMAEYRAALDGIPLPARKGATVAGTLAWLIEQYRDSVAWAKLSLATRRQRENIFKHVVDSAGAQPFVRITAATITAGRDRRSKTPHQARHFVTAMRGLFRWALERQYVKVDPTASVGDPELPETGGFAVWEENDVAAYEARWPIGTRQRIWLDLLIYTGLRRGDAVRVGRQHVKNGVIKVKTEKTGTDVTLTILPPLKKTLDAGPCGDLTFITGADGKPFKKESFGNAFSDASRMAGLKGKSAHGLRKAAAVRAALAGATVPEMNSMFGWSGTKMALHYIESADRERLSAQGMAKLAANIR